jgi:hypothetical protein
VQAYFSTHRHQIQRLPQWFFRGCVIAFASLQVIITLLFIGLPYKTVLIVHSISVAVLALTISIGFVVLWYVSPRAALMTASVRRHDFWARAASLQVQAIDGASDPQLGVRDGVEW